MRSVLFWPRSKVRKTSPALNLQDRDNQDNTRVVYIP